MSSDKLDRQALAMSPAALKHRSIAAEVAGIWSGASGEVYTALDTALCAVPKMSTPPYLMHQPRQLLSC